MKAYLSGPMTGIPEYNYPEFERVTKYLRAKDMEVVSPHEIPAPVEELKDEALWEYYMAKCKEQVAECDTIILMEGWPESRGARQELQWAIEQHMPVYFIHPYSLEIWLMSRPDIKEHKHEEA